MDAVRITEEELARLLRDAEKAHAEYESTLGHRDEEWPEWYARFIVRQVGAERQVRR